MKYKGYLQSPGEVRVQKSITDKETPASSSEPGLGKRNKN